MAEDGCEGGSQLNKGCGGIPAEKMISTNIQGREHTSQPRRLLGFLE